MEGSTAHTPKPNEFELPEGQAYAVVDIELYWVVEFLMTELEPVNMEDMDLNDKDCVCPICQEEFRVSEDLKREHIPVRLLCGHVFGRSCILRWFDPFCAWGLLADQDTGEDDTDDEQITIPIVKTSCPMCRVQFFPEVNTESLEALANRLQFWDLAYASAGVARSLKEEHSRKYLWQYVNYCRSIDELNLEGHWEIDALKSAQKQLWHFAQILKLKYRTHTPEQEQLVKKLERIGRKDLDKCAFVNGTYEFNIDSDDNERIEFAGQPLR